tara:strand:- start:8357 stop:8461 length:105 start_codon:yes stop_codon:yes gene_type:complete
MALNEDNCRDHLNPDEEPEEENDGSNYEDYHDVT